MPTQDSTLYFSARRFSEWDACGTRALHEELAPRVEEAAGPEQLLGSAGHEAIEAVLPKGFGNPGPALVDAFFALCLKGDFDRRGVTHVMADDYARNLEKLPTRPALWPAPHELLTVEAAGVPLRYRLEDIHGKPGFGVRLGTLAGGRPWGVRGRMDVAAVRDADSAACVITDWGFAKEKPAIAAQTYAVAASVMFPGFARYVTQEVYIGAGLRVVTRTFHAEEIQHLHADLVDRVAAIEAVRAAPTTSTPTLNDRCDTCPLRKSCGTYQAALVPTAPPERASVRNWPTDLSALSNHELLATLLDFELPLKLADKYGEALTDELKTRLAGEVDRVVAGDGIGKRLSKEGNGFEYPDVGAFIAWASNWAIPLHKVLHPIGNDDLMAAIDDAFGHTDHKKPALEALDKVRRPRALRKVLRDVKPEVATVKAPRASRKRVTA